ncbi:acetyl-CoA C-acyltransferase [Streptosporangium sp. NPDC087985]|uniref:acetyl-CoA C-acyltransferase n=1 Tax=Streptosporangium sp. NPDC087985 TaxID=3366196 RepID=UPI0038194623
MSKEAFIVEAVRTPRAKATPAGALASSTPTDLLVALLHELPRRIRLNPEDVNDVVVGAARQNLGQGSNLGRIAPLMAGWPDTVPGATVSRACASGLEALHNAAARVRSGDDDLIVAGGVESLSSVPMFSDGGPLWNDPGVSGTIGALHMGVAADVVATIEGFDRDELDAFGLRTQERATRARDAGRFDRSMVAITSPDGAVTCATDEHIRPSTTLAGLRSLEPAFAALGDDGQDAVALSRFPNIGEVRHLHTRGTSPSLADGAGVVVVANEQAVCRLGFEPRARIVATAVVGANPITMLTGGQDATVRVCQRAGLSVDDIDRFEFAEAFSALCLRFQRDLHVDDERFNVNGGTIAIGHAFGSTGPFLVANLIDELERSGGRYGIVSISGATGVGAATLLERI